jgi:F-type H+-transporting ATPase subunit a
MEELEHKSFIYEWLEHTYHHEVLPDHVIMAFFVAAVLVGFALWFKSKISVESPGKLQLLLETIVGALKDMLVDNVGEKGRPYLGLIGTLGLFILACNWIGLVPYFASPTVNLNFPVGCAIVAFLYYNYQGIVTQGAGNYFKHFLGPLPALAPLMLPIEIISHFSRIVSLSLRLFGNIFGEELVIAALAFMVAWLVPIPMMLFGVFGGLLQAFVFIMLTMVYLGGAVASEEH